MSYVPLARKYRPQTFADLVGQPTVTKTLTQALATKRLAQAYLFTGQRGVGKTSAARIFAKCLNCAKGPTATPCNACPSCTQIVQGSSLDVIEIDGASNRGIDEIRNLRETVPFAPTSGAFRLYIIDEVHMLTTEAFNALLKTLEEPPAHVKFIFATTAVHKVPPTILSRCQRFDFRRIEASEIVAALTAIAKTEQVTADEPALYAIARAADGSLRDAEVVLEQLVSFAKGTIQEADVTTLLGAVESETLFAWAQAILDHQTPEALALLTRQLQQGKDVLQLLLGLLRHVRNLLVVRSTAGLADRPQAAARLVDEPSERLTRLMAQADRLPPQELLLILQILTGAYDLIRRSPMAQTVLELVVIRLSTREAWQSLADISRRLEQLGSGSGAAPSSFAAAPAPVTRLAAAPPARSAPAASTAAPVPTAPAPISEELAAMWPVFLERLGAQKMSLAAYLMEARPLRLAQGQLTVGLPGFALHQEVLTEHRRLIEKLLSELCRVPVTVQYDVLAEPAGLPAAAVPAAPPPPPIVQEIVNLFNATVLDQPRPT